MEGRGGHRTRRDRGELEGWGVRLPAVADDPGAWARVRSLTVVVGKGRLVLRPAARPGGQAAKARVRPGAAGVGGKEKS